MLKNEIEQLIEDTARDCGYLIYESSIALRGENSNIRVMIDSISGISHNDCEIFTRELSGRIDIENLLPNYSMEVSSPGINRLLRNKDEFKRFLKAPCKLIYMDSTEQKVIKGIILEVTESELIIETEKKEEFSLLFEAIINAKLDY